MYVVSVETALLMQELMPHEALKMKAGLGFRIFRIQGIGLGFRVKIRKAVKFGKNKSRHHQPSLGSSGVSFAEICGVLS